MKLFQIFHKYDPYIPHFESRYIGKHDSKSFEEHRRALINDRFYGAHLLKPVLDLEKNTFYTMWDYPALQLKWAREKGWNETNLKKILFAQVEEFKPDVLYNCSPIKFDTSEIKNMGPDNMIRIAWFASGEGNAIDFTVYDTLLTNYYRYLGERSQTGYRCDLFHPSYDPAMDSYAANTERPTDIFFYGQYVPGLFDKRNEFIDRLIDLRKVTNWNLKIALSYTVKYKRPSPNNIVTRRLMRYFNIIEFPVPVVRKNSISPCFGLNLYNEISKSKIVLNINGDHSGEFRVNMRNIEALGCGAHMIGDDGTYPDGLEKGRDFSVCQDFGDFLEKATWYLDHPDESVKIAQQGHKTVSTVYSKEKQWQKFREIVSSL